MAAYSAVLAKLMNRSLPWLRRAHLTVDLCRISLAGNYLNWELRLLHL